MVPAVRGMITDDTGHAAGDQPDLDDRLGEHDAAVADHAGTTARPSSPGSRRCCTCRTRRSPRRSGCAPAASPSPAGPGRRTSRSRSRSTSATRSRCRSWRSRRCSPASPRSCRRWWTTRCRTARTRPRSSATCSRSPRRRWPRSTCRETGYAGDDLVGQSGLEAQYNTALTGKPGTQIVSVNAAGDVLGTVGGTPAADRRHAGDLAEREGPGGRAAGAQQRDRQVARGGQRRQPGRGRRGDDRPAGSWRWPATRTTTRPCGPTASRSSEVNYLFGLGSSPAPASRR